MRVPRTSRRSSTAFFFANFALVAAWSVSCLAQAQELSVRTARDGEFITISASAVMRVDRDIAWAVLSDYDHLARFIPDMKTSRVISRHGNVVRVEQTGDIGFFFYKEPVNVILDVFEEPPSRITARGTGGNIRALETRYELHSSEAGVKLDYTGRFVPEFSVPPLIGMPIMNKLIERRFRAMVNEIQRRDALAHGAGKPTVK